MMRNKLLIAPLVIALTGCSSIKYTTGFEMTAPGSSSKAELGAEIAYPEWYKDSKQDDGVLYAVASEYSKDLQFAVDKAMLSAKRELASNFSSHVSAMLKDYVAEVGEGNSDVIREIDRTTKLIVNKVNLVGVQRTNFLIVHAKDGGYRAFVRLRYATDDTNKLLVSEIKKNKQLNAKLQASKSFKEMEVETNKLKPESPIEAKLVPIGEDSIQQN
jgi:hypothetical protein